MKKRGNHLLLKKLLQIFPQKINKKIKSGKSKFEISPDQKVKSQITSFFFKDQTTNNKKLEKLNKFSLESLK